MQSDLRCGTGMAFPQTHWSAVLAAGGSTTPGAQTALADLCRVYWYPLYAFARRCGHNAEDAQDLTQGFFAHLIEVRLVAGADPTKGRFRSFLLGAFKRFIGSEQTRARAQKRGGGVPPVALDTVEAEARLAHDPTDSLSPELAFDRNWALTVLDRTLDRIGTEFRTAGRGALFDQLSFCLQGDCDGPAYAQVARNLGTTEGTIAVTVFRMRRRYRELIRSVVAETLEDPRDVEDELEHLRATLRR